MVHFEKICIYFGIFNYFPRGLDQLSTNPIEKICIYLGICNHFPRRLVQLSTNRLELGWLIVGQVREGNGWKCRNKCKFSQNAQLLFIRKIVSFILKKKYGFCNAYDRTYPSFNVSFLENIHTFLWKHWKLKIYALIFFHILKSKNHFQTYESSL